MIEEKYQNNIYQNGFNNINIEENNSEKIIEVLVQAVREEKFCPNLLPYKEELISSFIRVIHQQENN